MMLQELLWLFIFAI